MTASVKIDGLTEFRKALKELDRDLPKALRLAFNDAANVVVDDARPRVPKGRSGKAKGSVKARSTQRYARVSGGGNRAPYYPWLDFGGRVGKGRSVSRPFLADGRYIYRSFYKARAAGDFQDVLEESLIDVARQAGVEVSRGS